MRLCYSIKNYEVNVGAIGSYLPPSLLPPATLTVQSQDNGWETNAAFRKSNAPPPSCMCVCVCVYMLEGKNKKKMHSVFNVSIMS